MALDLTPYQVTGSNNGSKQVSVTKWNGLLAAIVAAVNSALGWLTYQLGFAAIPEMDGAVGDGVTDDYVALQAWFDRGGNLYLPAKQYYSSQKLIIRKFVRLEGAGYGFDVRVAGGYKAMPGSRIRFPVSTGFGIEIQNQGTITDIATALAAIGAGTWAVQEGGYGSIIRNIALIGPGKAAGGAASTGLILRTLATLENVHVINFTGKGIDVSATADIPDSSSEYGNASTSTLRDTVAIENGSHGLHIRGRDANTIEVTNHNSRTNGGWGILDESTLGNTYNKPHLAGNTLGAIRSPNGSADGRFVNPYIEGDVFNGTQLSGRNIVYGAQTNNTFSGDAPPTVYGNNFLSIPETRWHYAYDLGSLGTNTYARAYRHPSFGLVLQGTPDSGGACDVAILNKTGQVAFYNPSGSVNLICNGNVTAAGSLLNLTGADPVVTLGGNSDGVGSQFLMQFSAATKFQIYQGSGSTYLSSDSLIVRDYTTRADTRLTIDSAGINLASGKVLKVNGTQVVGARQTGTPAAATDAATTQALVNDIRAKLIAHGLIS